MPHRLEIKYGLTAEELLDAIDKRFPAKVTLEGAVAEVKVGKIIRSLKRRSLIERFEEHDLDNYPDYTLWIAGTNKGIRLECKNVRDSEEAYRHKGKIVAYKVETQKTRASKGDPTSRCYGLDQFEILAVCLGKKTGNWSDFLYIRTDRLERHAQFKNKLATMQRVPLPDSGDLGEWHKDLGAVLRSFGRKKQ